MSDVALPIDPTPTDWQGEAMRRRIRRRYAAERRFRLTGLAAILISLGFLAFLLVTMLGNGLRGFSQTEVRLDLDAHAAQLIAAGDHEAAVRQGGALFSEGAWLRLRASGVREGPVWLPASTEIDVAAKSEGSPEAERAWRALEGQD